MKQIQASDNNWIRKGPLPTSPFTGSRSMAAIEFLVNNLKLEEKTSTVQNVKSTDVLESVNATVDL